MKYSHKHTMVNNAIEKFNSGTHTIDTAVNTIKTLHHDDAELQRLHSDFIAVSERLFDHMIDLERSYEHEQQIEYAESVFNKSPQYAGQKI